MESPVLVVMAAGMGSRYGGSKQIDPMTDQDEIIIDFSLYDAKLAGFNKVIFIIKEDMKEDFDNLMESGASRHMDIEYAYQRLDDIPEGFSVPEGREKPWGTCHAVMSARDKIRGPFAVINADDFYGSFSFQLMYDFLSLVRDDEKYRYAMIGYRLDQTLTDVGHVSRGVCSVDKNGYLIDIAERKKILWKDNEIVYTTDDKTYNRLDANSTVSMNFFGFTLSMMDEMILRFPTFLKETMKTDPLKGEYLLPETVDKLISEKLATVKVLNTDDRWYGVTYKEDKAMVSSALQAMKDKGIYPDKLWR